MFDFGGFVANETIPRFLEEFWHHSRHTVIAHQGEVGLLTNGKTFLRGHPFDNGDVNSKRRFLDFFHPGSPNGHGTEDQDPTKSALDAEFQGRSRLPKPTFKENGPKGFIVKLLNRRGLMGVEGGHVNQNVPNTSTSPATEEVAFHDDHTR